MNINHDLLEKYFCSYEMTVKNEMKVPRCINDEMRIFFFPTRKCFNVFFFIRSFQIYFMFICASIEAEHFPKGICVRVNTAELKFSLIVFSLWSLNFIFAILSFFRFLLLRYTLLPNRVF